MEWLGSLQGQIIGLDTAPLIYLIEQNSNYLVRVRAFFAAMNQGQFRVITSVITLLEVLVHPLRANNHNLAQQYRDILFDQQYLEIVPVSVAIAEQAAQLRATYNLRTPDSLQLATALQEGATFFLTNDNGVARIPNLEVLVLDQL